MEDDGRMEDDGSYSCCSECIPTSVACTCKCRLTNLVKRPWEPQIERCLDFLTSLKQILESELKSL